MESSENRASETPAASTDEYRTNRIAHVEIDSGPSESMDTSWGQQAIWEIIAGVAPHDEHTNLELVVPGPVRGGLPFVLDVLRLVIAEHDSLRTRYEFAEPDHLRQRLVERASLPVEIWDVTCGDALAVAEKMRHRFHNESYDITSGLPIRAGVVMRNDVPSFLVLGLSHMVTDGWGLQVLMDELKELFDSPPRNADPTRLNSVRWQPRDQVELESSPAAVKRKERSVGFLASQLRAFPSAMFPVPSYPDRKPRHLWGHFVSDALGAAARTIAGRRRVSSTAAILAAFSVVLSYKARRDSCCLFIGFANRQPQSMSAIGPYMQSVPLRVGASGSSLWEIIKSTHREAMRAYRFAQYPPGERREVWDEVNNARGIEVTQEFFFNSLVVSAAASVDDAEPSGRLDAPAESSLTWRTGLERGGTKLYVGVQSTSELDFIADVRFFSPEEVEAILRAVELLLVEGAKKDVDPLHLLSMAGISRLPLGAGWEYIDHCWTDMRATRQLIIEALDVADCALVPVRGDDDNATLVAYVFSRSADLSPGEARTACFRLLPRWVAAMVPHYFVMCESAPEDPGSHSAWQAQRVLREGTGLRESKHPAGWRGGSDR